MTAPSPSPHLALRPERPEDEALLFEVYADTRQEELDQTNWDEPTRTSFLQMQFQAMRQGYASTFPKAEFAIVLWDDATVGRAVINRNREEIRLVDMAILRPHRNQGIGTELTRQLQEEAKNSRLPLRLRVFHDSPATRLYDRLGFNLLEEDGPYRHLEWRG